MFTVAALVEGRVLAVATGRNKRQAEQRAAKEALDQLRADAGLTPAPDNTPPETDDGGEG
jgi:dsRNA-specific ribonuclease